MRILFVMLSLLFLVPQTAMAEKQSAPVILIDAGHGGIDPGTQSADGQVLEKDLNLILAQKLAKRLQEEGFRVELTRDRDEDVTKYAPPNHGGGRHKRDLAGRVEAARQKNAALLISLHGNHGTTYNRGAVVYFQTSSFESFALASQLQTHLNGLSDRPYFPRRGNSFYILRASGIPSVLVEYGYLSNPAEVAKLLDGNYQDKLVAAMREGIWRFLVFYHVPK